MSDRRTSDMPDCAGAMPSPADTELDDAIKGAWETVRMPEGLASATLDFIHRSAQNVPAEPPHPVPRLVETAVQAPLLPPPVRHRRKRLPLRRFAQLLAACLVIGTLAAGSFAAASETAQVNVDGSESIELGLNRWGRVVRAESSDPELSSKLDNLRVVGMSCSDALATLASDENVEKSLPDDSGAVVLVVSCDNQGQLDATLEECQAAAAGFGHGAMCMATDSETRADAHESEMGVGRYSVFLEIQAIDPDISIDECRDMSMHELRALLAELQAETDQSTEAEEGADDDTAVSDEQCQGEGNGCGGGNGGGKGGSGNGRGMMGHGGGA